MEDPLSEKLLWKEFHAGETIVVDAVDGEVTFRAIRRLLQPPPLEVASSNPTE